MLGALAHWPVFTRPRLAGFQVSTEVGQQKLNLRPAEAPLAPYAARPTPGSADLCLITSTAIPEVMAHLKSIGVAIEEGPVPRTGAVGPITSVYFREPDGNLIEVSTYQASARQET